MIIFASCANQEEISNTIETLNNVVEPTQIETIIQTEPPTSPPETEPVLFNKNITFAYEYINNGDVMPHGLFIPSSASEYESVPLIVWLHGAGEKGVGKNTFVTRGLPKILNEWNLDGFNAYVLCPHLTGIWNTGHWNSETSAVNMQALLDEIIDNYNIDTNKIIISGVSLGGYGAPYMAWKLPTYFDKLVVMSGYHCSTKLDEIKIPAIGFVGTVKSGEDGKCVKFMTNEFALVFGEENLYILDTSHGNVPNMAFNIDNDNNNCSDLLEWMFNNN